MSADNTPGSGYTITSVAVLIKESLTRNVPTQSQADVVTAWRMFFTFYNEENCAEVVTVRRQTETKLEINIPRQTVSPTNHQIVSIHNRI